MNPNPSLARRALPALTLLGAAGTLVFALDRPYANESADGLETADATDASDGAGVVTASEPPATSATLDTTGSTTSQQSTTNQQSTTTRKSTTTEQTTPTEASSECVSYDGPTIDTRWGPVQVTAEVGAGGTICSVDVLQVPSGGKSTRINNRAVPVLNAEAVDIQSADVDVVSGATITSRAYAQSLQAILDEAA